MKDTTRELLEIYNNASPEQKELCFNIVLCASKCGQGFFEEMDKLLEQGDREAMLTAVAKWTALAKERSVAV